MFKMKSKLAFAWLKKNALVIVLATGILGLMIYQMVTRANSEKAVKSLMDQLDKARQDYEKANQLHREEILRREQIEEHYRTVIDDLTKKYGESVARLNQNKETRVRQIIAENKDDPNLMAQRLNSTLGFTLYHPGETP